MFTIKIKFLLGFDILVNSFKNKSILFQSDFIDAIFSKGMALGILGETERGLKCYNKALELDPDFKESWVAKGMALGILGTIEEAIECFDNALRVDPGYKLAFNKKQELLNLISKRNL